MKIRTLVMWNGLVPPNELLSKWLSRHCPDWDTGSPEFGIDHARNQNVRRFLRDDVPDGYTDLLMIDRDMVPIVETLPILTTPGELLYCGYIDRHASTGHMGPGNFGAACFRASADLLRRMSDPWFVMLYEKGRRVGCECGTFHAAARLAGAEARQVGTIGHDQRCIILPDDNDLGWALLWPEEIKP